MKASEARLDPKWHRVAATALGVLGLLTFLLALGMLVLDAHAHDFCDATCDESSIHVTAGVSAIAMLSSLVQIGAAANRSWRVALGALALTFSILVAPLLLLVIIRS